MADSSNNNRSILSSSYKDDSVSVLAVSEENFRRSIIGGSDEAEDLDIQLERSQRANKDERTASDRGDRLELMCGQCFRFLTIFKPFQQRVIKEESNTENNIQESKYVKLRSQTIRSATKEPVTTIDIRKSKDKNKADIGELTVVQTHYCVEPKYVKLRSQTIRSVTDKPVTTIDISTSKDKIKAEIGELTVVHTHYCVVTDKENKSVKVADTRDKTVKSEILVSKADSISSISSINDDQVAVAAMFKGVQRLLFFSVSTTGDISDTQRSIDVESPLYNGIIYSKNFFYTAALNQINIISMDDQTIKSIEDDSFGAIWGIALSNDHETIYICSYSKSKVFSLDLKGSVMASFMDKDLKEPRGITVDREGFVYVCSTDSRNVHRLAADLSMGSVIISGISVAACAFSQTGNRLCLASNCEIKVYSMNNMK